MTIFNGHDDFKDVERFRSVINMALAFALALSLVAASDARVWYVKGGGFGKGESWTAATGSIRTALLAAEPGDEVWVAGGEYVCQGESARVIINDDNIGLYGGFAGGETGRDDRDPQKNPVIVTQENIARSILIVMGTKENPEISGVVVDGFTFKGGSRQEDIGGAGAYLQDMDNTCRIANCRFVGNVAKSVGGGVYAIRCATVIENCDFTNNSTAGLHEKIDWESGGGGLCAYNCDGMRVVNCRFSGNASAFNGGGVLVRSTQKDPVEFIQCEFTQNEARAEDNNARGGGGLFALNARVVIRDCRFVGNVSASRGGGLMINNKAEYIIEDTLFQSNSALRGGGVNFHSAGPGLMKNCRLLENKALHTKQGDYLGGGGVFVHYSSSPVIEKCEISKNESNINGGGVMMYMPAKEGEEQPILRDCVISNNVAKASPDKARGGGGIYLRGASPLIERCEIFWNHSNSHAGGIHCFNGSSPIIRNCKIIENKARLVDGPDVNKTVAVFAHEYKAEDASNPTIEDTEIKGNEQGM